VGDNPAGASQSIADDDRGAGWEQISVDKPRGEQGHPAYAGFVWYRKHIHLRPAPGAPADIAMLFATPHLSFWAPEATYPPRRAAAKEA
jgi:hypothetical protein